MSVYIYIYICKKQENSLTAGTSRISFWREKFFFVFCFLLYGWLFIKFTFYINLDNRRKWLCLNIEMEFCEEWICNEFAVRNHCLWSRHTFTVSLTLYIVHVQLFMCTVIPYTLLKQWTVLCIYPTYINITNGNRVFGYALYHYKNWTKPFIDQIEFLKYWKFCSKINQ